MLLDYLLSGQAFDCYISPQVVLCHVLVYCGHQVITFELQRVHGQRASSLYESLEVLQWLASCIQQPDNFVVQTKLAIGVVEEKGLEVTVDVAWLNERA